MASKFETVPAHRFLGSLTPDGFLSVKCANPCYDFSLSQLPGGTAAIRSQGQQCGSMLMLVLAQQHGTIPNLAMPLP